MSAVIMREKWLAMQYAAIMHGVKWRHRLYGHDTIAILWV